jgi:hypothetical protein
MTEELHFLARSVLIGAGATLTMDLWAVILKRGFGIPSLDYAMVGRWIGHLPRGRLIHDSIAWAAPVRGEAALGWAAHYGIGIAFAALFLVIADAEWPHRPTPLPPVIFGILTVVVPFLILQPGLGAGIAASRTPRPTAARLRSLMTHAVFGCGLYLSAWIAAFLLRP